MTTFGFVTYKAVSQADVVGAVRELAGICTSKINLATKDDGQVEIELAMELFDLPHARKTFAETGVPEYVRLAQSPATRTRRSKGEPEPTEPTLPTVTKSTNAPARNRSVSPVNDAA